MTKVAVILFPGTNCELDTVEALGNLGADAQIVWHSDSDLAGFDGVVLPGGFAHGDYLRTGAIARLSPVMKGVASMAEAGRPVLGICNGFQILCEAGLLPEALSPTAVSPSCANGWTSRSPTRVQYLRPECKGALISAYRSIPTKGTSSPGRERCESSSPTATTSTARSMPRRQWPMRPATWSE